MNDYDRKKEDEILQTVNDTIVDILENITNILSDSDQKRIFRLVDYHFYHDESSEIGDSQDDLRGQCNAFPPQNSSESATRSSDSGCYVDCHQFIMQLYRQKREYITFLNDNLFGDTSSLPASSPGTDPDLGSTTSFGAKPIWDISQALLLYSTTIERERNITTERYSSGSFLELQGGGGSGMGFQLYCVKKDRGTDETDAGEGQDRQDNSSNDLQIMLTTGYGGGGGFYLNNDLNVVSFGGGGGGGIQIVDQTNRSSNVSTIGGGSGCGIANSQGSSANSSSSSSSSIGSRRYSLYCGSDVDDDASDSQSFQDTWRSSLLVHSYETCDSYIVYGGGGGGGGSDLCCGNYHFGYGFSFALATSPDMFEYLRNREKTESSFNHSAKSNQDDHQSYDQQEQQQHQQNEQQQQQQGGGGGEGSYRSRYDPSYGNDQQSQQGSSNNNDKDYFRLKYNLVGSLMNVIITTKSCSEGYRDWTCLCQHAKDFITYCLQKSNITADADSNETTLYRSSPLGDAFNQTLEYCTIIRSEASSLGWITNNPCSYTDQENTNNHSTDGDESSSTNRTYIYEGMINNTSSSSPLFDLYVKADTQSNITNPFAINFHDQFTQSFTDTKRYKNMSLICESRINNGSRNYNHLLESSPHSHSNKSTKEASPVLVLVFSVFFVLVIVLFIAERFQEVLSHRQRLRSLNARRHRTPDENRSERLSRGSYNIIDQSEPDGSETNSLELVEQTTSFGRGDNEEERFVHIEQIRYSYGSV